MNCTRCLTEPAPPGYRRCDSCRARAAEWARERKRERSEAGLCGCGMPKFRAAERCAACLLRQRQIARGDRQPYPTDAELRAAANRNARTRARGRTRAADPGQTQGAGARHLLEEECHG